MKRKYIQISLGQLSGNWTQKYQVAIQIGTSTVGEGLFIANLFPSFEQGVIIQPMQKKDGPCWYAQCHVALASETVVNPVRCNRSPLNGLTFSLHPEIIGCFWQKSACSPAPHLLHATVVRKIEHKLVANAPNQSKLWKNAINIQILLGSQWVHRAIRSLSMSQQFNNCVAIAMNQKPLVVWPAMTVQLLLSTWKCDLLMCVHEFCMFSCTLLRAICHCQVIPTSAESRRPAAPSHQNPWRFLSRFRRNTISTIQYP